MAEDYGMTSLGTIQHQENFLLGDHPPIKATVTIASGLDIEKGEAIGLNTSDSKGYLYDADADDGTQTLFGVIAEDVDASEGDVISYAYVHGDFFYKDLSVYQATGFDAGSYNNGNIVIKETK